MKRIKGKRINLATNKIRDIEPRYMIATKAIHKLGDISREKGDLCRIDKETDEYYIGNWVTGYGFIEVKFPKETTRDLTPEEAGYWNGKYIQIGSQPPIKLNVKG